MKPTKLMLTGVMIAALSAGAGTAAADASPARPGTHRIRGAAMFASPPLAAQTERKDESASQDAFLAALGAPSDDEVYEALYRGRSLADVAASHGADAGRLVALQTAELAAQLDRRLAEGAIEPDTYLAIRAELPQLVAASAVRTYA